MGFVLLTGLSKLKAQEFLFSSSAVLGDIYVNCLRALNALLGLTVLNSCPQPSSISPWPHLSTPEPSVPAPATPRHVCARAPHSPASGPIKLGSPTGWCPVLVLAWPCPQDDGWCPGKGCAPGCPAHWLGGWDRSRLPALVWHPEAGEVPCSPQGAPGPCSTLTSC